MLAARDDRQLMFRDAPAGDGKLTEAEIKQLSQGQATLKSGKVR